MDEAEIQTHTEIRTAIKQGDVEAVSRAIGSDRKRLDMMTPFGTWLHVAASFGQLEIAKRLVALGIDLNRNGGKERGNALDYACSDGHLDIAKYLLSVGSQMDTSEPTRNPLFAAIYGGHRDIAKLLIDSGIDTKVKYSGENMKNMDALKFAREWGRTDIANMILEAQKR